MEFRSQKAAGSYTVISHKIYSLFSVPHSVPLTHVEAPFFGKSRKQLRSSKEGVNPKTGETVQTLRSSIQEVPEANVLCLAAAGELLPQGSESLDPAAPAV